ncbi:MAG: efflux transporter outer membrane subunit [Desulfobacterales bacterium]|nr:MAG: efflux transporter outer membrane subunit [Desulfobacterales bacterium]
MKDNLGKPPKARRTAMCLLAVVLTAVSCSLFRPDPRQSPEGALPRTFALYMPGAARPDKWWEEFRDPELNALVEEALSGSFTLQEAWARLNQAQAVAVQVGSAFYPDLTATGGSAYGRQRTENGVQRTRTVKDYSLGIFSNYELDLWGRIRSERETARLAANATREDLNGAAITLAAEVTQRWANIISQNMQKRLLERQLQTNLIFLELVELRFRKAMVSALDVYQQRQVVEQVKAEIPLVEQREQLLRHELALLLGKPPRTALDIQRETIPIPVDIPDTGLPADLLAARPDVRAAGLRLRAADWQVAAARADRLPAISLTAGGSFGAEKMDLLFNNWLLSLAGNLTAPIFDGYRRAAEVDRTRAVVDENLAFYRETVLTAIKEVEDALISETKQREHIQGLERQISAARNALKQASERYRSGLNDYLPVLTQLLAVQGLERDLIQQQTFLLIDRINLYRALGGAWVQSLAPAARQ